MLMDEVNPCPYTDEEVSRKLRKWKGHCQIPGLDELILWAADIIDRRAAPENKPLTLEQLRKMDGEPVYIVAWPDWGHWELSADAEDYLEDRDEDFYGMTMPPNLPDPHGKYGLHMMGWLAYARKPEQEAHHEKD